MKFMLLVITCTLLLVAGQKLILCLLRTLATVTDKALLTAKVMLQFLPGIGLVIFLSTVMGMFVEISELTLAMFSALVVALLIELLNAKFIRKKSALDFAVGK